MRSIGILLLVVAIILAGLWFAGERGLVSFPYPPTRPWLREDVTITVVKLQGQCVVVDVPSRLITKAGRKVTWKIRARKDECAAHDVIVQFDGDDPTGGVKKQITATEGSEITATITTNAEKEHLYIYEILLASQAKGMGRTTLAYCPDWPCKAAKASVADDATLAATSGGPVVPTTTLAPGTVSPLPTLAPSTTITASPAPVNTPRPNP
jgi:hypothetical protein